MQTSRAGARVRLWVGGVLALAGWPAAFVCSSSVIRHPLSSLSWLGLMLAIGVLVWFGLVQAWSGLAGLRYLIGSARYRANRVTAALFIVTSMTQLGLWLGASPATRDGQVGWLWISVAILTILLALMQLASSALLIGGPRGLIMWGPNVLEFVVRIPWADIERVVFTAGLQPKTIEIGVALRPGAKPRRSSTRRSDVLLDLPCRVVVPQAHFDLPALQRLLAEAGRPEIALVERSGAMERPWPYPVAVPAVG